MTIISYAQNYEDIMLWRALGHIRSGFYIDVGANDPDIESVTRLFYDKGWSGINIEPLNHHHEQLTQKRPRDINIKAAIGNTAGTIEIWEPDVRGWATASKDVMLQHQKNGVSGQLYTVPQQTLAALCHQYVSSDIHFLKIDVEGLEKAVLEGADFKYFRPWVLVIEATQPNSTCENYREWEAIVTEAKYQLAYCDGLNRFYIAEERHELSGALRYPPNVFDDFKSIHLLQTEARLQETHKALCESQSILHAMENSRSWRVTAPLRFLNAQTRRICSFHALPVLKAGLKKLLKSVFVRINGHPKIREWLVGSLRYLPWFKPLLIQLTRKLFDDDASHLKIPEHIKHLTQYERDIYNSLTAPAQQKKVIR